MALAWDYDLDDEDSWDEYLAGLLAAGPTDPLPATIVERLEESRPRWQALAACRDAGVDFFDPGQVDAAQTLCGACAVRGPCGEFGQAEPVGVWGGRARGLPRARPLTVAPVATRRVPPTRSGAVPKPERPPKPKPVPAVCADCGERPARITGLCDRCYGRGRRRAAGIPERRPAVGPVVCAGCGETRPIQGRGLCQRCYSIDRRRARGAKPKQVGKRVAVCEGCGTVGLIHCLDRCARCYGALQRRRKRKAS